MFNGIDHSPALCLIKSSKSLNHNSQCLHVNIVRMNEIQPEDDSEPHLEQKSYESALSI